MASVLKKLQAFVPTIDDTVGNLQPAAGAIAPPSAAELRAPMAEPAPATPPPVAPSRSAAAEPQAGQGGGTPAARSKRRRRTLGDQLGTHEPRALTTIGSVDLRSLRRSEHWATFSLRVRPDVMEGMKQVAYEERITLGQLMDEMWSAYQRYGARHTKRQII